MFMADFLQSYKKYVLNTDFKTVTVISWLKPAF